MTSGFNHIKTPVSAIQLALAKANHKPIYVESDGDVTIFTYENGEYVNGDSKLDSAGNIVSRYSEAEITSVDISAFQLTLNVQGDGEKVITGGTGNIPLRATWSDAIGGYSQIIVFKRSSTTLFVFNNVRWHSSNVWQADGGVAIPLAGG